MIDAVHQASLGLPATNLYDVPPPSPVAIGYTDGTNMMRGTSEPRFWLRGAPLISVKRIEMAFDLGTLCLDLGLYLCCLFRQFWIFQTGA